MTSLFANVEGIIFEVRTILLRSTCARSYYTSDKHRDTLPVSLICGPRVVCGTFLFLP